MQKRKEWKRKERKQHVITEKLTPPTRVCRSKLVTAISSGTNLLLLIINNFDPAWHGQQGKFFEYFERHASLSLSRSSDSVLLLRSAALLQPFIVMGQQLAETSLYRTTKREELSCPCVVLHISSKLCWEVYTSVIVSLCVIVFSLRTTGNDAHESDMK